MTVPSLPPSPPSPALPGGAVAWPSVGFAHGEDRPALGLGTYGFGAHAGRRAAELAVLRQALELGWRVFDTAEMYADGGAESLLGQALTAALGGGVPALQRDALFVVSKVLPQHADAAGVEAACERSLRRLGLDQIDLYLLHWRGAVPLAETVRGFERLRQRKLIRLWGVSNFDLAGLRELAAVPGGRHCAANQVYFSLSARGPEWDLLPWQHLQQMPLMAYSPLDEGALADHPSLRGIAARHGVTPAQVALAWALSRPGVMVIPKSAQLLHLRHNQAAMALRLSPQDQADLDRLFPPPRRAEPLAMR